MVLLADFPVVILDEPAEHLDDETADAAQVDQVLRLEAGRLTDAAGFPCAELSRRPDLSRR